MRAPRFWQSDPKQPGWRVRLLAPLGGLYASATRRRLVQTVGTKLGVPAICVGNINAGGTGKTPATIAVVQRLIDCGQTPHVVTRGHGRSGDGTFKVDPNGHSAKRAGDEPLLIAAFAPTWVTDDRVKAARMAEADGASVIVFDDGFQDPAVAYDLSILVVDAERGFGNGRCIPAGPLREPAPVGLARATALLSIGPDAAQDGFASQGWSASGGVHLRGALKPLATGMNWSGMRLFAFAGIGYPKKFFDTLRAEGVTLAGAVALDDHQELGQGLINRLIRDASAARAQIVTTEKDAVRLPEEIRRAVLVLPVRLELDESSQPALDRLLEDLAL